jgi:hypothetical protein
LPIDNSKIKEKDGPTGHYSSKGLFHNSGLLVPPYIFLLSMPSLTHAAKQQLIIASVYFINIVGAASNLYSTPWYWKQPYHTLKLTGAEWVKELIHGHYDRIWTELGVRVHVFLALEHELQVVSGMDDLRYVELWEQLAIFLYMCVTGLSV